MSLGVFEWWKSGKTINLSNIYLAREDILAALSFYANSFTKVSATSFVGLATLNRVIPRSSVQNVSNVWFNYLKALEKF